MASKVEGRLPQRFQYKTIPTQNWQNGICMPPNSGPRDDWTVHAGAGYASFDEDPWEVLGQIIGDVAAFRWIDNDNCWHPIEEYHANDRVVATDAAIDRVEQIRHAMHQHVVKTCEGDQS